MGSRRIVFSNPRNLLVDTDRLQPFRTEFVAIANDISDLLNNHTEAEREANVTLRNGIIDRIKKLDEF